MQNDAPLKMTKPEACGSMEELRVAIDTLDVRLVALLAVRQAYIERAAQLKTARDQVRDSQRIEEVVAKVIAEGRKAGLSAEIAEAVWRSLIEASIPLGVTDARLGVNRESSNDLLTIARYRRG